MKRKKTTPAEIAQQLEERLSQSMSPDDVAVKHLGHHGTMISGSKSGYLHSHPKSEVFFNANLYNAEAIKIWFGDVDITKSRTKLQELAKALGGPIYLTREQPWRWDMDMTVEKLEAGMKGEYPDVYKFTP